MWTRPIVTGVFACASLACGSAGQATQVALEASADVVADSPGASDAPGTEAAFGDVVSPSGADSSSSVDDGASDVVASDAGAGAWDGGDFLSSLPGIWLIGWSGGLNHYSWVRLGAGAGSGLAEYLSGADLPINAPYWNCTGAGTWMLAQRLYTVSLAFPAACALPALVLTFESFYAPPGGYPRNATLAAHLSTNASSQPLGGWKFAASQCNATMTMCNSPL